MKYHILDIGGEVAKEDERYRVVDNKFGHTLVLSSTLLNAGHSTTGHYHEGQEEVYFFVSGTGQMQLDDETFDVEANDVVTISDGVFHRVFNTSDDQPLYFVCVFDGNRRQ